jgi:hypothetical protein
MKKSLAIFIVVFLVLALATLAFAAKPDIFDKGTGLDISPTFSYTSTVETGDKGTGLDISTSSSYTSTVDKADKGTGLDKKQEKDVDKSNFIISNSSSDNGGYKRTDYTTSTYIPDYWTGRWVIGTGTEMMGTVVNEMRFVRSKNKVDVEYLYRDVSGNLNLQGTSSLNLSKDGFTLTGRWTTPNKKGLIQIYTYGPGLTGSWSYKKNLDWYDFTGGYVAPY